MNNKGFMLAEVVVVSVVVVTIIVTLYAGFNRVYTAYNERSKYYDVDGLYALKNIADLLIEDNSINNITSNDIDLTDGYYKTIKDVYDIENAYILDYNFISNSDNYSNGMNDYINYLDRSLDFDEEYDYILLLEREVQDKYYYSSLRIG